MAKELTTVEEPTTAIAKLVSNFDEMREVMAENLGGADLTPFSLPRAKVAAGGAIQFLVGTESVKQISGIAIHAGNWRSYWSKAFGAGGEVAPPDCQSADGLVGVGDPGGSCKTCPLNEYGTATKPDGSEGRGKACKEIGALFFIRDDAPYVPTLILIPPTSLKAYRAWKMDLAAQGIVYWKTQVTLSLQAQKNADGIAYSSIVFAPGERLTPAEVEIAKQYREAIGSLTQSVMVGDIAEMYGDDDGLGGQS